MNENFTDPRDGKTYKTVKIGKQTWMAENLNYEAEGSKCYDNDPANGEKYGRLYDWETAMKVCPPGWHLPSNKEWQELANFAGGDEIAGEKLKATDGFSALLGGSCRSDGSFCNIGGCGYWWSSSECGSDDAYNWIMISGRMNVYCLNTSKGHLQSVRYLQDSP
ncbi:MAG: fibrobacter succinogenes major paralogous domain-containing protein [Fibromonadales bacterium]|nr:fibrobacter succinogenes major paralogous domain-containing protein [Fibromonadales bacterium]